MLELDKIELKKMYAKQPKIPNRMTQKTYPYIIVFVSFCIGIVILFLTLDYVVMPLIVHDRGVIKVPRVIGMKLSEAQNKLRINNLDYHLTTDNSNTSHSSDAIVTNQFPRPGTEVKFDRRIYLAVEKDKDIVTAPNLIGQPLRSAMALLMERGLILGDTLYVLNSNYMKDTIVAQSVPSGHSVSYGSKIDVTISQGPENLIDVPQLIGVDLNVAKNILLKLGLQIGTIQYIKEGTYIPNTIDNQSPKSGDKVPANTPIDVTVIKN